MSAVLVKLLYQLDTLHNLYKLDQYHFFYRLDKLDYLYWLDRLDYFYWLDKLDNFYWLDKLDYCWNSCTKVVGIILIIISAQKMFITLICWITCIKYLFYQLEKMHCSSLLEYLINLHSCELCYKCQDYIYLYLLE